MRLAKSVVGQPRGGLLASPQKRGKGRLHKHVGGNTKSGDVEMVFCKLIVRPDKTVGKGQCWEPNVLELSYAFTAALDALLLEWGGNASLRSFPEQLPLLVVFGEQDWTHRSTASHWSISLQSRNSPQEL